MSQCLNMNTKELLMSKRKNLRENHSGQNDYPPFFLCNYFQQLGRTHPGSWSKRARRLREHCSRGCKANIVTVIAQDTPPLVKTLLFSVFVGLLVSQVDGWPRPRLAARVLHSFQVRIVAANLPLHSEFFIRLCLPSALMT